jgi:hypothetical protein
LSMIFQFQFPPCRRFCSPSRRKAPTQSMAKSRAPHQCWEEFLPEIWGGFCPSSAGNQVAFSITPERWRTNSVVPPLEKDLRDVLYQHKEKI